MAARRILRCIHRVVQGHEVRRHPEVLQLRYKRRTLADMRGAGVCVSVVSAEVHVREGRRTERVRPVPDVVVAGNVYEGIANCARWARREQIELAVAKHDLVIVAEVLVETKRS